MARHSNPAINTGEDGGDGDGGGDSGGEDGGGGGDDGDGEDGGGGDGMMVIVMVVGMVRMVVGMMN